VEAAERADADTRDCVSRGRSGGPICGNTPATQRVTTNPPRHTKTAPALATESPSHTAANTQILKSGRDREISWHTSAQDSNVLWRQAEARLQLGVIEVEEQHADALLAGIVLQGRCTPAGPFPCTERASRASVRALAAKAIWIRGLTRKGWAAAFRARAAECHVFVA
jgi:hypothetical protein